MADKISGEQVLQLMLEGWECAHYHGVRSEPGRWTLQANGLGKGGDTVHPHGQTMNSLISKGLIVAVPYKLASFRTQYVLAECATDSTCTHNAY